jgi:hypothetical protein
MRIMLHKGGVWIVRIFASFIVVLAILLGCVQVADWQARRRTEKLIGEMYQLKVGQTTLKDAQGLVERWSKWKTSYGPDCERDRCEYSFVVDDSFGHTAEWLCGGGWVRTRMMFRMANLLHAHLPSATLDIQFDKQILTNARIRVTTHVPKDVPPGANAEEYFPLFSADYELLVHVQQRLKLDEFYRFREKHPGHFVARPPDGCEGCVGIDAFYSPEATHQELERLLAFNLSCMTKWKPCEVQNDIAPVLWAYFEEQK